MCQGRFLFCSGVGGGGLFARNFVFFIAPPHTHTLFCWKCVFNTPPPPPPPGYRDDSMPLFWNFHKFPICYRTRVRHSKRWGSCLHLVKIEKTHWSSMLICIYLFGEHLEICVLWIFMIKEVLLYQIIRWRVCQVTLDVPCFWPVVTW